MRVVVQRVTSASVTIDCKIISSIDKGILIFVGIEDSDNEEDISWLIHKIVALRIFNDDKGVMNKSLVEIGGSLLIVSQFTLHASTKKGNRPSYIKAAPPTISIPLYRRFCQLAIETLGSDKVKEGVFGADMQVKLVNDGPVTILMDTKQKE